MRRVMLASALIVTGVAMVPGSSPAETIAPTIDEERIRAYLESRGVADLPAVQVLLSTPVEDWPALTLPDGRTIEPADLSGVEADYFLGRWLIGQGESVGAVVLLQSGLGTLEERLDAIRRLTPGSIEVDPTAVEDAAAARGSGTAEDFTRGAYLQRLSELTGETLEEHLAGFNTFALEWNDGFPPSLQLRVTDDDAERAEQLFSESPALQEVDVVVVSVSAAELATNVTSVGDAIRANSRLRDAVGAVSSGGTNEIVVIHPLADERDAREIVFTEVANDAQLDEMVRAGTVRVGAQRERAVLDDINAYGGIAATTCTWGFNTTVDGSGAQRLMTAGHCGNTQEYYGVPQTFTLGVENQRVDAQSHVLSSGFQPVAAIYNGSCDCLREISSRTSYAGIPLDGATCRQGKNTGWRCGFVTDKTGGPNYDNFFIEVQGPNYTRVGGDSGGPHVLGQSAYGVHHGGVGDIGYFGATTGSNFAEDALGVTVRTK